MKNIESIKEFLKIAVLILPLLGGIFVLGNVCFNFFYFVNIDINFLFLLSIQDYYEAAIPYLFLLFFIYVVQIGYILSVKKDIVSLKKLIFDIVFVIKDVIVLFVENIVLTVQVFLIKKKYRDAEKKIGSKNKKLLEIAERISSSEKKNNANRKKLISSAVRAGKSFTIVTALLIFIIIPIFIPVCIFFSVNMYLFASILLVYVAIILFSYVSENDLKMKVILFIILYFTITSMSGYAFSYREEMRMSATSSRAVTLSGEEYILVRIIAKGVIVRNENGYFFFKWEDVKNINKGFYPRERK